MTRHASMRMMLARREQLHPTEEARVAAHLDECAECRERAHEYAAQRNFLRSFRREPVPAGMREAVMAAARLKAMSPRTTTGHRPYLRRPVPRRTRPGTREWSTVRWAGIVLAAALALAVAIFSPLVSPRGTTPASAELLLRTAAQVDDTAPSRGTAVLTYTAPGDLTERVVHHRTVTTWAESDPHHYRTVVETVQPAIDSGTLTITVDGAKLTQYDTRTNTVGVSNNAPAFYGPQYAANGGTELPGAADAAGSIQHFLDSTQQDVPSSVHHFAKILGTEVLSGRKVHIVQFAPITRGIQCLPTSVKDGIWQGTRDCNTPADYGVATVWIDDVTHIILKYRADLSGAPTNYPLSSSSLFEVTSFEPGKGASEAELSAQPPAGAEPIARALSITDQNSTGYFGGVSGGQTLRVPPGFPPATAPTAVRNAQSDMGLITAQLTGNVRYITGLNILFTPTDGQHFGSNVPKVHYLSVQERVRAGGLPTELQSGTTTHAGTCTAWWSIAPDGLHTLALARGRISIVLASDTLPEETLVGYAANTICT